MTPSEGKSEERDCESGSSVNPSAAANVFWKGRGEEEIVFFFFSLLGQLLWKRRCRFFVF